MDSNNSRDLLENKLSDLEKVLLMSRTDAEAQLLSREDELLKLQYSHAENVSKLESHEATQLELKSALSKLNSLLHSMELEISSLTSENSRLAMAERDSAENQNKIRDLEVKIHSLEIALKHSEEYNTNLHRDLQQSKLQLSDLSIDVDEGTQKRISYLEIELSSKSDAYDTVVGDLSELRCENEELATDLTLEKEENALLKTKLAALISDSQTVSSAADADALLLEISKLKDELSFSLCTLDEVGIYLFVLGCIIIIIIIDFNVHKCTIYCLQCKQKHKVELDAANAEIEALKNELRAMRLVSVTSNTPYVPRKIHSEVENHSMTPAPTSQNSSFVAVDIESPQSSGGSSDVIDENLKRRMGIFYNTHWYVFFNTKLHNIMSIVVNYMYPIISPSKLSDIPKLLKKYSGKESELIINLEAKYKAKFPSKSSTKGVRFSEDDSDIRRRLIMFYRQNCPSKLSTIDHILDKYRGDEEGMIFLLERKYNAKFPRSTSMHSTSKSSAVQSVSSAPNGILAQFPPSMTWIEANLRLFLQKHDPENVQLVPRYLKIYKGRETEMVEILERKYNAWFPQL